MKILSIETSCDETGIALVEAHGGLKNPRFKVLKNLVASQIEVHRPFGGVVPNLAKREHAKNLPILFRKIFGKSNTRKSDFLGEVRLPKIDLIAVTVGPGLEPALWQGIEFAKALTADSRGFNTDERRNGPFKSVYGLFKSVLVIGANHLEGHLYSFLLPSKSPNSKFPARLASQREAGRQIPNSKKIFPAIALIVSGGHTLLLHLESFSKWKLIGETRDDAAGEAFDKVARLLELPYPGGPEIEKLAAKGNSFAISFPRPMLDQKNYDFSFSGLKTSVLYYLRDLASTNNELSANKRIRKFVKNSLFADVAASFEQAVIDVLVSKTKRAAEEYGAESILLSGGVAANKHLRKALKRAAELIDVNFFAADLEYNLDNAAMIAAAGYFAYLRKKKYPLRARGDLSI
ncbi:MAG: tRNA (adenosine(37)-N6)-threonylcarbamoyltransferase complex transferase subunit TsaD [Patescibacteria group bacterium]